ncbi:hypothetical protein PV-S19_0167 [Pacmanvirus S19]|nr:hypothetical protein PV-S19_0167 [Pacmanvirus S19]
MGAKFTKILKCVKLDNTYLNVDDLVNDFIGKIRPLDLIVFRTVDPISSGIQKLQDELIGYGEISHVGVAISREYCDKINVVNNSQKTLYCWESTASGWIGDGVKNAETGKASFGVQLRNLREVIKSYLMNPNANIGVCRLIDNPILKHEGETTSQYDRRIDDLKMKISIAYDNYNSNSFEFNPLVLLGALFPPLRPLRDATYEVLEKYMGTFDKNAWLFCSEFVCLLYQQIGVITDETDGYADGKLPNPENCLPVDLLSFDTDVDGINKPIVETPPIWIKNNRSEEYYDVYNEGSEEEY